MAKQSFVTGQVLTAAQLTSLQQTAMLGGAASAKTASYTLVAADAGTAISMSSTSATTITVNTGLFASGDTVQITNLGSGVTTITAGTATVNSSASLALAQYESGTLNFRSASAAIFIKGAGAAPASGGMTLLSTTTFSSAVTTLSSFGGYKSLKLIMYGFAWTSTDAPLNIRPNGSNVNNYITGIRGTTVYSIINGAMNITDVDWNRNESNHVFVMNFDNYTDTSMNKTFDFHGYFIQPPASNEKTPLIGAGSWLNTNAITSLEIRLAGTVYQGTALLYGVN